MAGTASNKARAKEANIFSWSILSNVFSKKLKSFTG